MVIVDYSESIFVEYCSVVFSDVEYGAIVRPHVIITLLVSRWPLIVIKCEIEYLTIEELGNVDSL